RAGDRAAAMNPANRVVTDGSRATGMATMAVLQQAARAGRSVWIGYVDAQGVASQRVVEPVSIGAGVLEGFDSAAAGIRRFSLHRITSVALAEE
ncbi:MAG: WYL domain-containing protein, partial [Mycobacteriaceae bacterium]